MRFSEHSAHTILGGLHKKIEYPQHAHEKELLTERPQAHAIVLCTLMRLKNPLGQEHVHTRSEREHATTESVQKLQMYVQTCSACTANLLTPKQLFQDSKHYIGGCPLITCAHICVHREIGAFEPYHADGEPEEGQQQQRAPQAL